MTEQLFELVIVADTNDADYVTNITKVTQEELDELAPVFEAIKSCTEHYNWPDMWDDRSRMKSLEETYPQLTEDQIEMFMDYTPSFEGGIHSVKSIEYYPLPEKVKVL